MTSAQILKAEIELIKTDLIARYNELGLRASGQWADSLENRTKGLSGQLWGMDYTEILEDGRRPGKMPPVAAIEQWILDKKIIFTGITLSSLAYVIARKIGKEGTRLYPMGTDLITSVITPERIQSILDKVSEFHINEFMFEFRGVLTAIAAANGSSLN